MFYAFLCPTNAFGGCIRPHITPKLICGSLSGVQTIPFATAFACIRLGHKYQIDHLLEESLKFLRYYYTYSFDLLRKTHEKSPPPEYAISVVNLVRLTGAHYLLPMALAECCRLGSAIVNGRQLEDGTREYLSQADLGLCFQAKDRLVEARVQAFARMFDDLKAAREDVCECEDADDEDFEQVYGELLDGEIAGLCSPNVWDSLAVRIWERIPEICKPCRKALFEAEREQQKAIFERLPDLVGVTVEGWGNDIPRQK